MLRVSEYLAAARGEDELYFYLREVFASEYEPTSLHRLLARVAKALADGGRPQLLVVTTNYDDLVERALSDEAVEYDVVWYEAKSNSEARGRFVHRAPGGKPKPIPRPNKYTGLPAELERPAELLFKNANLVNVLSGEIYRTHVAVDDGRVIEMKAGDVFYIAPGHDSWVVGDEPYVSLHLIGAGEYAQHK